MTLLLTKTRCQLFSSVRPAFHALHVHSKDKTKDNTAKVSLAEHKQNIGACNFLRKVYHTTGLGIFTGLATAETLHLSGMAVTNAPALMGVGFVASLGSALVITRGKCTVQRDEDDGTLYSVQPLSRKFAYGTLCGGMGAVVAPMVAMVNSVSPTIFPVAVGLSLCTMLGASAYAYARPYDALSTWGPALMGGLTGMVTLSCVSLGSTLFLGPNVFSDLWMQADMYGGVLLFTAMTAYDTHMAVKMYEKGNPDHIGCATDLYLDFMNLFVRFMEVMAKARK